MGIPILVLGKSGSGKSASIRNFKEDIGIVNVLGKPLPFKNSLKPFTTDDYGKVYTALNKSKVNSIVIDDAGYLMTNQFMKGHSTTGKGNDIFGFYNDIGDNFWRLIRFVTEVMPPEKIVYFFMHEEKNDFGDIKPKSIGKMLDEKVCIEGMFTICFRCSLENGKHIFKTQSDGYDICKTPIGMFEGSEIDNDLKLVDDAVRDYYELGGNKDEEN